jgi:hypothetical protein
MFRRVAAGARTDLGVTWCLRQVVLWTGNEQAAKKAKSYLEQEAFSRERPD